MTHQRGGTRIVALLTLCILLVLPAASASAGAGGDSALSMRPGTADQGEPESLRDHGDEEGVTVSPRMNGEGTFMLPDKVVTDETGRKYTIEHGVVVTEVSAAEVNSDPDLALRSDGVQTQGSSGCNSAWYFAQLVYQGQIAWRLNVDVSWCYDGSMVTSYSPGYVTPQVYGWASLLGYAYTGTQQNDTWDYFGNDWLYRTFVVGGFERCTGPWGCNAYWTATVRIDRYGDGSWQAADSVT